MRRIVVSGASGFLGSYIIKEAVQRAIPTMAITTRAAAFQDSSAEVVDTDDFLVGKIRFSKDDVFINCLFPTNADGIKMANGLKTVYSTITTAKESGIGSFINISSQSVYPSKREEPATEDSPLSLETPYAVGKYSSEAFVNEVFKDKPHTNIRLASLIGIGYDQRIVNRMVINAINGERITVVGGMQRYGFLDVRDAASGLVHISQSDLSIWKNTYNLGRLESYTLLETAALITHKMREHGFDTGYDIKEGVDTRNSALDASLFMQEFEWEPEISFEQTVEDIINNKL